MKIIDAHIHFSKIESFRETAGKISLVDYSGKGLEKEFGEAGIVAAIGMGLTEQEAWAFPDQASPNPMGLDLELDFEGGLEGAAEGMVEDKPENGLNGFKDGKTCPDGTVHRTPAMVACCIGINPVRLDRENIVGKELDNIEMKLARPEVVGIKLYAGYYPYYVFDKVYEPVYRLALKYNLPVVIHGGATYSDRAYLKYSHPLAVDELAVKYRDINFVIAHLGDPWVMDTAAVVSKNPNVYADLSGLIVADGIKIASLRKERLFMDHIMRALVYAEKYNKFLFGSDWPLAPVKPYIEFVKDLVPEEFYEDVFWKNAVSIFPRLKNSSGRVKFRIELRKLGTLSLLH
ncbi:MAG: amidohydrolase family protein [Clostridiaceae bacterium]|nr:amidohydrolase family protein [Clostridiaceae bacterium]